MPDLSNIMAAIPGGNTRRYYGTAYWDGTRWRAKMGDGPNNLLDARWLDPIQPLQGGKIVVDISKDEYGGSTALVIGGYTDQPRPSTGVILAFGVLEIVISGEDGVTYTTGRYLGPIEGYDLADTVYITWDAAIPTILGKVNEITITPAAPAPGPAPTNQPGSETLIASASDTWWGPGGWGSYATSRNGGEDVYSGSWYGNTVTGAWFYGAPRPVLQGKTISRIRFRLPARLDAGNYNDPATIHLYAHTNSARPGSDVNRVTGPHDEVIAPRFQGGDIDLPLSFAPALLGGGGVSIAGDPYVRFASRLKDPNSGRLIIDWSS